VKSERYDRKHLAGTHEEVGKEECPLESVPAEARARATALLAKKATLETIVVLVSISWHTGLTAAKRFTSSTAFLSRLQALAAVLEAVVEDRVGKFRREVIDGKGKRGITKER
jgi:hypothetical protein